MVGAGGISGLHLEGIGRHGDRAEVVAMCDPDAEALAERAGTWNVAQTFAHVDEMIAGTGLDVAVVCTPTHVRGEVVIRLIEAGIPVLCEKPFAETYAEAAGMEAAARRAGVPVAVNQNFRRHFTFALARDVLASGRLGEPLHLVQAVGAMRRDKGWRLDRSRYVMSVMSIHWFDGYRFVLDDEPVTVTCRGVDSPATDGGPDTAVSIVLEFVRGAVACLSESFSSFARPQACCLDCQRGGLVMGYETLTEIGPDGGRVEHANPFDKAEATWWVLDDLLGAVEQGRSPETSADDNLKSMRILEAAYRSLQRRQTIAVEEIE
ncbi:MAG: Gfo/Idh/MocA family protein [Planctomycetota bacterium]|jgi:predicted dehydrogenase